MKNNAMMIYERSTKFVDLISIIHSRKLLYKSFATLGTDKRLKEIFEDIHLQLSRNEEQILVALFKADPILHFKCCKEMQPMFAKEYIPERLENYDSDEELIKTCCGQEKEMITVYRELLNEVFIADDLRMILRFQLNEILYRFSRLKLLKPISTYRPKSTIGTTTYLL